MTTAPNEERIQHSASDLTQLLRANFTGRDLVDAIRELSRSSATVTLPEHDQKVWDAGINDPTLNRGQASARNVLQRIRFIESTLDVGEVAQLLHRSESTIRHYIGDHQLYSFLHNGRRRLPSWQFIEQQVIPGLGEILPCLAEDVHPQAVSGFFVSPNPDLVINGQEVSPVQWLSEDRDPRLVAKQATGLGDIM